LAVIPCLLAFLLLFWLWAPSKPLRLAFFASSVTWGLLVWLFTESLGYFHLITRNALLLVWSLVCLLLFAILLRPRQLRLSTTELLGRLKALSTAERLIALAIMTILVGTALNAIVAPPNTDDAMEYHLPRVILWANNQSVSFFPSYDVAQLIQPPWAEYAILHLYVLTNSDRLLNLVEWFSFLGCILGASLIAQFLGGGRLSQFLAALLAATLPAAILEASGCNTSAVAAFWTVAAVVALLSGGPQPSLLHVAFAGGSLGLSVLTKGTSAVFIPGILLGVLFILRPKPSPAFVERLLLLAASAILVLTPQGLRNIPLTGHFFGPPYPEGGVRMRYGSESLAPTAVFSSVLRNAAVHLSLPSSKANAITEKSLRKLILLTGTDPNDPRTTWRDPFGVPSFTTREYYAGNQGQFLLILAVAILAVFRLRPFFTPPVWLLAGCALSFVSFAAAVKWIPSAGRYHLPLFVLAGSAASILLLRLVSERIALAVAFLAFLASLLFVADNGLRSFLPMDRTSVFRNSRDQLYFIDDYRQDELAPYSASAQEVHRTGCTEVGLDSMFNTYIYPMMALVHESDPGIRFQYAGVENATARYSRNLHRPAPCAVICLGCMRISGKWKTYASLGKATIIRDDNVVFWPGGQTLNDSSSVPASVQTPEQLVLSIEQANLRLRTLPEFAALATYHELDSPFQRARGAALRAKRDAVYELRMRADLIFQWSEPLRLRALHGSATSQDLDILQMTDQAFLGLIKLVYQRGAEFLGQSQ